MLELNFLVHTVIMKAQVNCALVGFSPGDRDPWNCMLGSCTDKRNTLFEAGIWNNMGKILILNRVLPNSGRVMMNCHALAPELVESKQGGRQ